jgi:hypothetical protein
MILYVAIHSYGELILYPFGHTNEPVPNAAELVRKIFNLKKKIIIQKSAIFFNNSKPLVTSPQLPSPLSTPMLTTMSAAPAKPFVSMQIYFHSQNRYKI